MLIRALKYLEILDRRVRREPGFVFSTQLERLAPGGQSLAREAWLGSCPGGSLLRHGCLFVAVVWLRLLFKCSSRTDEGCAGRGKTDRLWEVEEQGVKGLAMHWCRSNGSSWNGNRCESGQLYCHSPFWCVFSLIFLPHWSNQNNTDLALWLNFVPLIF